MNIKKLRSSGMTGFVELVDGKFRVIEGEYCEYPQNDSNNQLIFEHPEKFGVGTIRESRIAWKQLQEETKNAIR